MKKTRNFICAFFAAILLLSSFAATAMAAEPVSVFEYQKAVGIRCNKERATEKRAALALDLELNELALKLAMEQEGYYGSSKYKAGYRADGQKWTNLLLDGGYSYVEASHVVVASTKSLTANALVDAYMRDTDMKKSVLYPRFTYTGLNMYYSEKDALYYYVQIFALPVTSATQAAGAPIYKAAANTNVNVRAGAGSNYDVVGALGEGRVVAVDRIEGKWTRIQWNNSAYAYVYTAYLTPVSASIVKATASVAVRVGPGIDFKKLGTLKKGAQIAALDMVGDWTKIIWKDGSVAYVYTSYLAFYTNGEL